MIYHHNNFAGQCSRPNLVWRQWLQRGNDITLFRQLLLVLPKQVLNGPLCCHHHSVLVDAKIWGDVHGQLAVLCLLCHTLLQHHTGVHLHHAHVQHAIDPGQLCVFGLAELQRAHQGVFQPHLYREKMRQDEDIELSWKAAFML